MKPISPPEGVSLPDQQSTVSCSLVVLDGLDPSAVLHTLMARMPTVVFSPAPDLIQAVERDGPVLVVMPRSEDSLAACLLNAVDAGAALSDWLAARRSVLATQRRNRRRVSLIDSALLADHDDEALAVLARRLGVDQIQSDPRLVGTAMEPAAAPVRLAALALGQCHAELASVMTEIDAATIGRSGPTGDRAVFELLHDWQASRHQAQRAAEDALARVEAQNAALSELVSQLEQNLKSRGEAKEILVRQHAQELDAAEAQAASLAERIALLEGNRALQIEAAQAQARRHAEILAELEQSHREALHRVRDDATRARQLLEEEKADRARQDAQSRAALQTLRAEADGALKAHEAAQTEVLSLSGRIALLEENVKLQLEATDMQARLHLAEQAARDAREQRAQETRALRDAVLGAQALADGRAIARLVAEAAQQNALAEALKQEITKVYVSKSWRVTGPLRAAMSRLGAPPASGAPAS
jgi:hypothetical protein